MKISPSHSLASRLQLRMEPARMETLQVRKAHAFLQALFEHVMGKLRCFFSPIFGVGDGIVLLSINKWKESQTTDYVWFWLWHLDVLLIISAQDWLLHPFHFLLEGLHLGTQTVYGFLEEKYRMRPDKLTQTHDTYRGILLFHCTCWVTKKTGTKFYR